MSRFEAQLSNPITPNDPYGGAVPPDRLPENLQVLPETGSEDSAPLSLNAPMLRTPLGEVRDGDMGFVDYIEVHVERVGGFFNSPMV